MCGTGPVAGAPGPNPIAAAILQLQASVADLKELLGATKANSAPAPVASFVPTTATAAQPTATNSWLSITGASAGEVAQIRQLVQRASASPTAQKLFNDLSRTGLRLEVRDDALDQVFASDPKTVAYEQAGVVYLRRSELAKAITGDRLIATIVHESTHAADTLTRSRVQPALDQLTPVFRPGVSREQQQAELSGVFEARAYGVERQVMTELGVLAPRTGGFGNTGVPLARVAAGIVQVPAYGRGATRVIAQGMSDAVLGHGLLG
jgi:hypothetical protein